MVVIILLLVSSPAFWVWSYYAKYRDDWIYRRSVAVFYAVLIVVHLSGVGGGLG